MFYDRAGRSEGRAEVSFEGRLEAQMAQDTFQNVPLDGMPMRIELTPLHSSNSRTFAGGNPRQDYGRDRTPQGRWTHDRVPADDRLKTSGRPMSMDVLDDDLDSYMMGRHA